MSEAIEPAMTSVQVLVGPGIVARYGDVLLWLEEGGEGGQAVVARLLGLARELAQTGDGRQAGGMLAEVLRTDPTAVPALALVAPTPTGLQAVVHGWARVLADGVDIDGGWADRELAWTTALAAGRGGDVLRVPKAGSVLDLRRGSTPGGGAAVTLRPRQEAAPAGPAPNQAAMVPVPPAPVDIAQAAPAPIGPIPTPSAQEPSASFERIDLQAVREQREPLPIGGSAAPTNGTTVKGVVCSRGHFNSPTATSCSSCGISMADVTRILQDGVRPSLGALVLDDGTAFGLDMDHVLGTDPGSDASVAGGGARPVVVADPTGQVAPVHAEVRLVGWDVVLVARAPSFVLAPGTQQWMPAPPGQPSPLVAGARLAIGQRTFVYE